MIIFNSAKLVFTQKYASLSGRASRSEYWSFTVFCLAVILALLLPNFLIIDLAHDSMLNVVVLLQTTLAILFVSYSLIPTIALTVRRFHDVNLSGWWYLGLLVLAFVPYLGVLSPIAIMTISLLPSYNRRNRFGERSCNMHNEVAKL